MNNINKLIEEGMVRNIVRTDIGDLVSHEIEIRFKSILKRMDTLQVSIDNITQQLQEDRQDLNQLKIDMSKNLTQNKVIIENQNTQENKVVEAVAEAADKIPDHVEESIDKIFEKKGFMGKIVDKLTG